MCKGDTVYGSVYSYKRGAFDSPPGGPGTGGLWVGLRGRMGKKNI